MIVKRFAFQYVNSYVGLLYTTFYLQDLERLRSLLAALLIVSAALNNLTEMFKFDFEVAARKLKEWSGIGLKLNGTGGNEWVGKCLDNDLDR